jgi:hypothetical protein
MHLGDANDFYALSSFDKNPDRIKSLQADLDITHMMFRILRQDLPSTEMYLLLGNHEDRLRRFLWSKATSLSSLRCLELESLYGTKDFNIHTVDYEKGLLVNNTFLFLHGDMVRRHSSYTAKGMYEKHGGCGIHGHTHRGGKYIKRDRFGIWGWWESFCLCQLEPDWIKNPDWHQGFSLVHIKGERFWVEQIPIIGNKFMYGGEIYE